jgi:hypothetical protein
MAEATPSISRHTPNASGFTKQVMPIQARITTASFVLAMQRARSMVKEELKRQRIRLADVEAREITARAKDYLIAHPELVADARPVVESWFARGVFGKRVQKAFKEDY